jgi:hypothetical protein
MKSFTILSIFCIILATSFLPPSTDALWGHQKEHMEQAKDSAYESAQKAKEAAQKAYEAVKEGTLGFGERVGETAGAAKEAVSSVGGKMADTVGGAFQGARETAGNIYEGAKEQAGNIYGGAGNVYEGAKERVQDTAEAMRERAAQMAGMGREKGEEMRRKAEDIYDDASFRAKQAKHKSQSWMEWLWQSFWDIILFIPRTILNALSWAWQTTCDEAGDTYEGAREWGGEKAEQIRRKTDEMKERAGEYAGEAQEKARDTFEQVQDRAQSAKEQLGERAQHARDAAGQTAENIKDCAGQAKDTILDKGQQGANLIREKVGQAGEYLRGGNGEEFLERSREMGEQVQGKARQAKGWFRCQMERIFKVLFTLATFGLILFLSIAFLSSPQRRTQMREGLNKTADTIRNKANEAREKGYIPVLSRGQSNEKKPAKEIPVQHHEKLSTTLEEKDESEGGIRKTATSGTTYAEKTREREDPHKQRT